MPPSNESNNSDGDNNNAAAKKPDAPATSPRKKSTSTINASTASLLNAQSASALLKSVDGPSLATYSTKESVYVGRQVPVAAGADLKVPIQVDTPGSVIEYAIEIVNYDVNVAIRAERSEGNTTVKETTRITTAQSPLTQKFLVGTVPCQLIFTFDNTFSWLREKTVSYKITVTPPTLEALHSGRRRRAQACLQAVREDLETAEERLESASSSKASLQHDVAQLMQELAEKKKAWQVAEKEEKWLLERRALRLEQEMLLQERLQKGWPDEDQVAGVEFVNDEASGSGKEKSDP